MTYVNIISKVRKAILLIITLFLWLLIIFQSAVIGHTVYRLVFVGWWPELDSSLITPQKILVGFVLISSIVSIISLFLPLNSFTFISIFLITIALSFIFKPKFTIQIKDKKILGLLILILLFSLETATRRPNNPDTNLYHAQAIHWLESFPVVPGLGNLHGRLAFNSIWFIDNAFYSLVWLTGQSLHVISGFYFFLFSAFALTIIARSEDRDNKISLTALLIIFFAFQFLAGDISSPGTDTPTALTVWLVLLIALSKENLMKDSERFLLLILLPIFAVTIKLSSVLILLIPLGFFIKGLGDKNHKSSKWITLLTGFILIPYLIRNIVQSGYLLYPFPTLDIFQFAWKVPISRVIEERDAILVWGRLPGQPIKAVLDMPIWTWLPAWFNELTLTRRLIAILTAASPLFFVFNTLTFKTTRTYQLLHSVFIIGSYFWLLTSPDFRFGFSFLIPTIILSLLPFFQILENFYSGFNAGLVKISTYALIFFVLFTFASTLEMESVLSRAVIPRDYDQVKTQPCDLDDLQIYCSVEYNACSYHDFPCIPQQKDWVHLLGNELREGFFGIK